MVRRTKMIEYELIICFTDFTWITNIVEVESEHIDSDDDVYQIYREEYEKDTTSESKEIAFIGVYGTKDIDNEEVEIAWKPHPREYPLAGLETNEAYENLLMGKSCHPDVEEWIPVYTDTIKNLIVISYDGKNGTVED